MKGTSRKITSQEGGFLNFLRPLMTAVLPLMKSVITQLVKSVLLPLAVTAAASATDAAIQRKIFGSGATALTVSDKEKDDIMKIVKFLEYAGFLIKGFGKTIKSKAKEQKDGNLSMILGTLAASLFGNMLRTGDGVI